MGPIFVAEMKTVQSSYRDRINEFLNVAEKLKKSFSNSQTVSSGSAGGSKGEGSSRSAVSIQSEFNKKASKIGFGIHQTSQKLAKLAKSEAAKEHPGVPYLITAP